MSKKYIYVLPHMPSRQAQTMNLTPDTVGTPDQSGSMRNLGHCGDASTHDQDHSLQKCRSTTFVRPQRLVLERTSSGITSSMTSYNLSEPHLLHSRSPYPYTTPSPQR